MAPRCDAHYSSGALGGHLSLVAIANAFLRARETARPADQRVLEDRFAAALVRSQWRLRLLWTLRGLLPGLGRLFDELQTAHVVRHAAVDALLVEALSAGSAQVVLLGAGLDARSRRLGERFPHVRWFEVDRSAHVSHKAQALSGGADPEVRVHADLTDPRWFEALRAAGLDPEVRTVWVAEGLVHYLPESVLVSLLSSAREFGPSPCLILSFIRPDMAARGRAGGFGRLVSWLREIPQTFYKPDQLGALARDTGWSELRTWDFDAQVRDFAPAARARPAPLSQDVAVFDTAPRS